MTRGSGQEMQGGKWLHIFVSVCWKIWLLICNSDPAEARACVPQRCGVNGLISHNLCDFAELAVPFQKRHTLHSFNLKGIKWSLSLKTDVKEVEEEVGK